MATPLDQVACPLILLVCLVPLAVGRLYCATLNVSNGGTKGARGPRDLCPSGSADGFAVKLEPDQGFLPGQDDTALDAIQLHCAHGGNVTSSVGKWGACSKSQRCWGALVSFQLQAEPPSLKFDATAANNLRMKRQGEEEEEEEEDLEVPWDGWGQWGSWSPRCPRGAICGLRTRAQPPVGPKDAAALNDVRFFCRC